MLVRKEKIDVVTANKISIILQDTPEYLEALQNSNEETTTDAEANHGCNSHEHNSGEDQESTSTIHESMVNSAMELDPYIHNRDYLEYVIQTAKKTVRQEDSLVRILVSVGLTVYSNNPLSIGIRAPTSEGKTYAVMQSSHKKFFPKQDVIVLGSLSPKALIRQHGILVDKDNRPLKGRIKLLNKRIIESQNNQDTKRALELQEELVKLNQEARWLIDLSGKILLFLEPPDQEVWNILKPILSHDAWDIEHPYVDADLKTKNIVTRGWPTCIFCSAKDESRWDVWPEIQSRFLITSPNMSHEKYLESNILTFQRSGLPNFIQQKSLSQSLRRT